MALRELKVIPLTCAVTRVPICAKGMKFDEPSRIEFEHDPARRDEKAGVEGCYVMRDAAGGTGVHIELSITVELPFPRLARPAVHTAMRAVVATMGARFSHNLVRHLDRTAR